MHFHHWVHVKNPGDKIGTHENVVCTKCGAPGLADSDYYRVRGRIPTQDLRGVGRTLSAAVFGVGPTYKGEHP